MTDLVRRLVRPTRGERRRLLVVFDAILPAGADPRLPLGARDLPLERFLQDLGQRAPTRALLGLRLVLWLVWLGPLPILGRPRTFAGLGEDQRVALLDALARSRSYVLREAPMLLKTLACLGYCGHPDVHAAIGLTSRDATPPAWAAAEGPQRAPGSGR